MEDTNPIDIRVGYGTAKGEDSFAVGAEASRQAMSGTGGHPLSAVLVFASVRYDLEALLDGIHSVVGDATVIGATTAGEICDGPQDESVVVVALASPHIKVRVGVGDGVSGDWQQAVSRAVSAPELRPFFSPGDVGVWRELTRQGKTAFAMLFSPGNTRQSDSRSHEILEELKRLSGGELTIVGGSAADDWRMETNYVLSGRRAHPDGLLVAVFEMRLCFGIALAHGFRPGRRWTTVTRACNHEVLEMDGRPAAEVYAELLDTPAKDLEGKHLTLTTGRLSGIPTPYGEYSVNVASYFTEGGGVRFAQPVPEGIALTIMEVDEERVIAAGQDALHKAMLRGRVTEPAVVFVFSCALRPRTLGESVRKEIPGIMEMVPGVPVVGFYSFGEQGLADDGVNRHNNDVVAVLVLGRRLSEAARVALENERLLKALREKSAEQALLLDTMETQVWYLADIDTYGIANRAHAEFLGMSREDIEHRRLDEFLPQEVADVCRIGNRQAFETKETIHTEEWCRDGKGEHSLLAITKTPKLDEDGNVEYLVCVGTDITERVKAEKALRESKERLDLVVKGANLGMWDWNIQTDKVIFNEYWAEMLGYTPDEIEPHISSWKKLLHPDDAAGVMEVLNEHLEGQTPFYTSEHRLLTKSGDWKWILDRGRVFVRDENGKPLRALGIHMDITERVQLEEHLRRAQKLEAVGVLAGGVAHHFNNMLTAILGNINLAMMEVGPGCQAGQDLKAAEHSVRQAADLTMQLLAIGRKSQMETVSPVNLNTTCKTALDSLRRTVDPGIEVAACLADDLWTVAADPEQMSRVLMSLCLNALDALSDRLGGKCELPIPTGEKPTITIETENVTIDEEYCRVHVEARHGRFARLTVSDNGCGMDASVQVRIFEPFFTTKEVGKGTGLGLAMTHSIVSGYGGWVSLHSEPGVGTAVSVYLPHISGDGT